VFADPSAAQAVGARGRETARQHFEIESQCRRLAAFMAEFGAAMTGVKPKTTFLKPGVAFPMALEVLRQILKQKVLSSSSHAADSYKARALEDTPRLTAFQCGGLLDRRG